MLHTVYNIYGQWVSRYALACRKGCSACCTQSVTMTSLEGMEIVEFFNNKGEAEKLADLLAEIPSSANSAPMTTNQFARLCLEQREIDDEDQGTWNFAPCFFLDDGICTIYDVRPFGCRSFGSQVKCTAGSPAEVAPLHVTVNTVFMQIIEHLNSDGGHWGNMVDILKVQTGQPAGKQISEACSLPGFIVAPEEGKAINKILSGLYKTEFNGKTFLSMMKKPKIGKENNLP